MRKATKIILTGTIAGMLVAPALLHHALASTQTRQAAGGTETQAQQTAAGEATARLVTEQIEGEPYASDAAEVICRPVPPDIGDLTPITHFICSMTSQSGLYWKSYSVTIPPGWQEGQETFASVSLTNPNN